MWGELGNAATVAQLVGADLGGLISKIIQAAATARRNKAECEQLAVRASMIYDLLPHLQHPEVVRRPEVLRPLALLEDTLREAHQLVTCCQHKGPTYRFVMAGRLADKIRSVQARIDSYLLFLPLISHIDIIRCLDQIHRVLISTGDGVCRTMASPSADSQLQRRLVLHGDGEYCEKFTMPQLAMATNNFAVDRQIGEGRGFGSMMYKGRLPDRREVAIRRASPRRKGDFLRELAILSPLCHHHIVRLLGCCVAAATTSSPAEEEEEDCLLVYEYVDNGTLYDHLHGSDGASSLVTTSWKTRIEILAGVSRAIDHLHSHAAPPVIHRDIKLSNILLDSTYAPRLSDFGLAVSCDEVERTAEMPILGTFEYMDPEYLSTGNLTPASDVYSFGVVMLELLTGKKAIHDEKHGAVVATSLVASVLPNMEAGDLMKEIDRGPGLKPTPRQLEATEKVARTAVRCVHSQGKERPPMTEVVASLQEALELLSLDE
ncbi:putative serine/threonine-protein kinase-like protein CCR3 [Oryza glaberrima]|uniref:Protein kinase domain-containing protein n=1 Tax=Oryza glaberrima TaxID=4538 RepID=I1QI65_ORYGL|nr:putative serine/threonine-protein kinase-like protein CCR3 [Oryza glaberrima]